MNGIDTTFLVEAEVEGHPHHAWARGELERMIAQGDRLALAPQVLTEFLHVITDARRFSRPLAMAEARERALAWWEACEITPIFPTGESTRLFLSWMEQHGLGRKRLLDTQLAATYHAAGIRTIYSTNARDYRIFTCFEVRRPPAA
jgi:predicted nucleic acid-binding protein